MCPSIGSVHVHELQKLQRSVKDCEVTYKGTNVPSKEKQESNNYQA